MKKILLVAVALILASLLYYVSTNSDTSSTSKTVSTPHSATTAADSKTTEPKTPESKSTKPKTEEPKQKSKPVKPKPTEPKPVEPKATQSTTLALYKEGVHYAVINQGPKAQQLEIKEYFSFLCPHCFQFYLNVLPKLEKHLPKGVKFTQSHVDFLGGQTGKDLSRAFAVAELLNVKDKMDKVLFDTIHVKRQHIVNMSDIRKLFVANGVDGKEFDSVVNSFAVNARVAKMARDAKDDQINGVPELVINGKYKVLKKEIKTWDDFIKIAVWVAKHK